MTIRVVTLASSVERETEVASRLQRDGRFDLSFRCVDRSEVLATLRAGGVDVALAVGIAPWFDFQCMEEADRGGVRLFGLAADPVEADLLEVNGFTVVRDLDDLLGSTGPVFPRDALPVTDRPSGKVVGVWGPKGAPGRTTVSIELAAVLSQTQQSTLLIDADLYGGDVAQLLGVAEEISGLVPLSRMGARGELRGDGWVSELRRVPAGPVLLPGLLRAELWGEVSAFGWEQLLEAARTSFTTTVVDVGFCLEAAGPGHAGPGRNDVARATLEAADRIVSVLRADPLGIRSFLWSFTDHRELLDLDRCVVVVNRVRPGEETEVVRFVRRHLGRSPLVLIPDRPDHLMRAAWEGVPVVVDEPSSPVSSAMRELAAGLGGTVAPRGFLTRLAGRRIRV